MCTSQVFAVRQVCENYVEHLKDVLAFMDSDTIGRNALF